MVINFGRINSAVTNLVEQYKESGGNSETFARSTLIPGGEEQLSWWKEFFEILDDEIDHGTQAIYDGPDGKLDYLGGTGEAYWLATREYMLVIKSPAGRICIDYLPGAMQGIKIRSARIMVGSSIYFIRENSINIIDYPIEWITGIEQSA